MNSPELKKTKIGQGYYQSAYGRGFNKKPIVWEINGKAYVKDANNTPYETDLKGYVMVNQFQSDVKTYFFEAGLISEHIKLNKQ